MQGLVSGSPLGQLISQASTTWDSARLAAANLGVSFWA